MGFCGFEGLFFGFEGFFLVSRVFFSIRGFFFGLECFLGFESFFLGFECFLGFFFWISRGVFGIRWVFLDSRAILALAILDQVISIRTGCDTVSRPVEEASFAFPLRRCAFPHWGWHNEDWSRQWLHLCNGAHISHQRVLAKVSLPPPRFQFLHRQQPHAILLQLARSS